MDKTHSQPNQLTFVVNGDKDMKKHDDFNKSWNDEANVDNSQKVVHTSD